jgi:hypothetical protein
MTRTRTRARIQEHGQVQSKCVGQEAGQGGVAQVIQKDRDKVKSSRAKVRDREDAYFQKP